MAAGLGILRLSPASFWAMTLSELAAAMRGLGNGRQSYGPLERDVLQEMMTQFPDELGAGE